MKPCCYPISKTTRTKITAIIALAAILSLSVLVQAQAAVGDVHLPPHGRRDVPDASDFSQARRVDDGGSGDKQSTGDSGGSNSNTHHKIKDINRLFRSSGNSGS
ncbi:MAG: hypothetical protein ACJ71P_19355, partial [Nitrososphaeraceae archaeon]